jgi:hypothetical protein
MPPQTRNEDRKSRSPKRRIYQEEAKTRQTSHWDWDYLPSETLERLARDTPRPSASVGRPKLALIWIAAGVLAIVGLLVLFFVF